MVRTPPEIRLLSQERRFLLSRDAAAAFVSQIARRLVLEVYDPEQPIAFARTTYLDTEGLGYFRSTPVAKRLRIREYAAAASLTDPPVLTGVCALELKESSGASRKKARWLGPPELLGELVSGTAANGVLDALAGIEAFREVRRQLEQGLLAARLTTFYRRASLVDAAGDVRVTMDEGIRYCLPASVGRAGEQAEPCDLVEYGPGRVIEVKTVGDPPAWLREAMSGLLETPGYSKFRVGYFAVQRAAETEPPSVTLPINNAGPTKVKR